MCAEADDDMGVYFCIYCGPIFRLQNHALHTHEHPADNGDAEQNPQ